MPITPEDIQRQKLLEEEMLTAGVARYREQVEAARQAGREDETSYGSRMLLACVEPLAQPGHPEAVGREQQGRAGQGLRQGPLLPGALAERDADPPRRLTLASASRCAFGRPGGMARASPSG